METKHKNALIGALLAVVFVMAVGYAAFAQQLTINGSASISSSWNVHIKSIEGAVTKSSTSTNGSTSAGSPTKDGTTATFDATLISPGDEVTYTVTVENTGTITAQLTGITLSVGTAEGSLTEQEDLTGQTELTAGDPIVYSVEEINKGETLAATNGTKTFKVKVVYNDKIATQPTTTTLKAKLALTYEQAQN